jgi:hypothetical protein
MTDFYQDNRIEYTEITLLNEENTAAGSRGLLWCTREEVSYGWRTVRFEIDPHLICQSMQKQLRKHPFSCLEKVATQLHIHKLQVKKAESDID